MSDEVEQGRQEEELASVESPADEAPEGAVDAASDQAEQPPAEEPAAEVAAEAIAEAPAAPMPIGPRWFEVRTASQPDAVKLLLRDATSDAEANAEAIRERFKFGHGILETPHAISVTQLPADYVPTGADVDHDQAIEIALAKRGAR